MLKQGDIATMYHNGSDSYARALVLDPMSKVAVQAETEAASDNIPEAKRLMAMEPPVIRAPLIQHSNGWFDRSELPRFMVAMINATGSMSFMKADLWRAKYLTLRIDQRTGDFLVGDGESRVLTTDEIYRMFPELKPTAEVTT